MPRPNTLLRTLAIALPLYILIWFASVADAETHFVNNISGSNRNNGLTDENQGEGVGPLRSISAALKKAKRGDRIVLANTGAFYEECVTLQGTRHSGSSFAPFVIEGNGATLDGTAEVPAHQWEFVRDNIFQFAPERSGFQQLFIEGELAPELPRVNGSYVSTFLKGKEWYSRNGAIQFACEKGKSVYSYDFRYAKHRVGITLYDVENVVIHDLKVRGFQLDGINAHDNAMDCIVSKVTSTENGRSGVAVCGASRVRIVESQLRQNGAVQLHMEGWSTTHLNDTKLVAKYSPVWKRNLNAYGRGARLVIDEQLQTGAEGWNTEKDEKQSEEQSELNRGLDDLEEAMERNDARPFGELAQPNAVDPAADLDEPEAIEAVEELAPAAPVVEEALEEDAPLDEGDDPFGEGAPAAEDEGDLFEDFGGDDAMDGDEDPFGEI